MKLTFVCPLQSYIGTLSQAHSEPPFTELYWNSHQIIIMEFATAESIRRVILELSLRNYIEISYYRAYQKSYIRTIIMELYWNSLLQSLSEDLYWNSSLRVILELPLQSYIRTPTQELLSFAELLYSIISLFIT